MKTSSPETLPSDRSRRIARNTVFLYFRMFLLMAIGLFTSRVVLQALGKTDVGVYNAVGGVVMMFTVVTNSLSTAISRFLTYGMGERDAGGTTDLRTVFSTGVVVELILSGIIFLLVETVGLWFLNGHYNIPPDRLGAANWVMQCAMLVLVIIISGVIAFVQSEKSNNAAQKLQLQFNEGTAVSMRPIAAVSRNAAAGLSSTGRPSGK